jgi:hypothetical protein
MSKKNYGHIDALVAFVQANTPGTMSDEEVSKENTAALKAILGPSVLDDGMALAETQAILEERGVDVKTDQLMAWVLIFGRFLRALEQHPGQEAA